MNELLDSFTGLKDSSMNYALRSHHELVSFQVADLKEGSGKGNLQVRLSGFNVYLAKPYRPLNFLMTDTEEVKHWHRFIDGDLDALSVLFLHYAKGLVSYGMKIYRDEELVKDAVQEVFIQLIQKRLKLKRDERIKGLVYRLLRNSLIDEIKKINRSRKTDYLMFSDDRGFEADIESQHIVMEEDIQRNELINSALLQLSSHQKEAMFLKYADDFSYEQISEVMGISIASSRTLIYRTLKQMKRAMGPILP